MKKNKSTRLREYLEEIGALRKQRDEITLEIFRSIRLLKFTARSIQGAGGKFREAIDVLVNRLDKECPGLTDAIKIVLRRAPGKIFSPIMIREELEDNGFTFTKYRSNPLVSINSVLKRIDDDEAIAIEAEGRTGYQWKIMGSVALLRMLDEEGDEEEK